MRDRLRNFMYGRYGSDQFNRFLSRIALILFIASFFIRFSVIYYCAVLLWLWTIFRMLSRNTGKRSLENDRFMDLADGLRRRLFWIFRGRPSRRSSRWEQSSQREYRFFQCPQCRQKMRVPRGKGRIEITCPQCRFAFIKRT